MVHGAAGTDGGGVGVDGTEDVAVIIEMFPFKLKGFFSILKKKIHVSMPMSGLQLQPNHQFSFFLFFFCCKK